MKIQVFATLGPSSMNRETVKGMARYGVDLFRINLSHTPMAVVADAIDNIRSWTDVPVCLDSEGAQIRNGAMISGGATLRRGDRITVHFDAIEGDSRHLSLTPATVGPMLEPGDRLRIDFDSAAIRIIETFSDHCLAVVEADGHVGTRKAVDLSRPLPLAAITPKDREAIAIGKALGIRHFALSFAENPRHVDAMRELTGPGDVLIAKIESAQGVLHLSEILATADEILVDRGDLSRQVPIEKIPFLQRRIVSMARAVNRPVHVATNLLESMILSADPTRAEVNDVVSTLLMGATGLVLAAETAIGRHPVAAVEMVRRLIDQYECWTPNTSIEEVLRGSGIHRMSPQSLPPLEEAGDAVFEAVRS